MESLWNSSNFSHYQIEPESETTKIVFAFRLGGEHDEIKVLYIDDDSEDEESIEFDFASYILEDEDLPIVGSGVMAWVGSTATVFYDCDDWETFFMGNFHLLSSDDLRLVFGIENQER